MKLSDKLLAEIREEFEDLFPKDREATLGLRPSKSNRSAGLVLYGLFMNIIRVIKKENENIHHN